MSFISSIKYIRNYCETAILKWLSCSQPLEAWVNTDSKASGIKEGQILNNNAAESIRNASDLRSLCEWSSVREMCFHDQARAVHRMWIKKTERTRQEFDFALALKIRSWSRGGESDIELSGAQTSSVPVGHSVALLTFLPKKGLFLPSALYPNAQSWTCQCFDFIIAGRTLKLNGSSFENLDFQYEYVRRKKMVLSTQSTPNEGSGVKFVSSWFCTKSTKSPKIFKFVRLFLCSKMKFPLHARFEKMWCSVTLGSGRSMELKNTKYRHFYCDNSHLHYVSQRLTPWRKMTKKE